nr:hypothetical protein 8 [bacterium]
MKAILILFALAILAIAGTRVIDIVYETAYFNKLTPEQQEVVIDWLTENTPQQ